MRTPYLRQQDADGPADRSRMRQTSVMTDDVEGVLIRHVRLQARHLPVPIYTLTSAGREPLPIQPTWMGVVHWSDDTGESYELSFYEDNGRWVEGMEYDTLEIAIDQGADIVGVLPDEWESVEIVMPDGREGPAWTAAP